MLVIGIVEDGEVQVFDDEKQLLAEWGQYPRDLESSVITLYDECGKWLEPVIAYAPRRWFGLGPREASISFRIVSIHNQDAIQVALAGAISMRPNSHFQSLVELRRRFGAERGAA